MLVSFFLTYQKIGAMIQVMSSPTVEDYAKQTYLLQQQQADGEPVSTGALAEALSRPAP